MARKKITMRSISTISTFLLIFIFCLDLSAQHKPGNEKVLIEGKMYTLYTAISGDSPFGIARKFGITLDELKVANPQISEKLNAGQVLRIPVTGKSNEIGNGLQKENQENGLFIYHSVKKRETVFSIAQKRKITSEDIYHNNPQARDGIKEGDVLKIPKPYNFSQETKTAASQIQTPKKHTVSRGETLYSISNKYNVTQEAILKLNPAVKGNLKKGTILLIPVITGTSAVEEKSGVEKFELYRIVNGDNYFQLQKRFGTTEEELVRVNPALKDGLKVGLYIKIPVKKIVTAKETKLSQPHDTLIHTPISGTQNSDKTFEVGLFMPFCQNLNDSSRIVQRTASFLEFYSGVLLATEKAAETGMKLQLYVYDTYQNNKIVEKLVKKPEFLSLDLIIGPVYPENQKTVAELSGKNHIPMVSPLSSDSRYVSTTPGYYQINPGKRLRIAGTADYIADKYAGQNIIVLNHGTNSADIKLIIDRLTEKIGAGKFSQYNIMSGGTSALEAMLKADRENIIVLAESSEANVSVSMTRLNTISKTNKITVVGLQEYTKMQSIDVEYLHNTRLHYLAPYFVDYTNPHVNAFVDKYRAAFGYEPTQYSFQGYDIALHFLTALRKSGKNLTSVNDVQGVNLLQADYSFQKISDFGGFVNQTLNIIEYTDTYDVMPVGKIHGTIITENEETKDNEKNGFNQ